MKHINEIKNKYKITYGKDLPIVEDCAHCWNSKYNDELIGNSGNYCCFSFQAIKFLTMGDGGLLITPNAEIHNRAKLLRWFGLDRDKGVSMRCIQNITETGFKYQLTDIAATIGLENLPHIKKNVAIHKDNANFYNKKLNHTCGVYLLNDSIENESCHWLYTIKVDNRTDFIKTLKEKGIESGQVHNRCDKYSCASEFKSLLPGMDNIESQYVCIPCGWWVTEDQRSYIVDCINEGW
jgi:dTDP-4-amino-4,6-dideoxygalactose transaminase